jgi:hypothetical protein
MQSPSYVVGGGRGIMRIRGEWGSEDEHNLGFDNAFHLGPYRVQALSAFTIPSEYPQSKNFLKNKKLYLTQKVRRL